MARRNTGTSCDAEPATLKTKSDKSFFFRRELQLKIAASLYVTLLILSHATFPQSLVWFIAALFSIAMNFTYVIEAVSLKAHTKAESTVAVALILLSMGGIFLSPILVIIAIFSHGCWDLFKHYGSGVPFFTWYTLSCAIVDFFYGSVLLIYWAS